MKRPTIALCCIMKDEIDHIRPLLESVAGCFDEIHLTDTGSTDGTIEFAESFEAKELAKAPIFVKHFAWIEDFAAARNHSMQNIKTDYVMWLDLDDALSSKEEFILWRDNVLVLSDFWLAPYNYAFDPAGKPICTFLRERIVKTSKKFEWEFFIHEGMIAKEPVQANVVTNWTVDHRRTEADYHKDYARNVSMLEKRAKLEELPPRLQWYFGKELHDKGRFAEAYVWLDKVVDHPELELHDRILCFEYLVRSCLQRFFKEEAHRPAHERDMRIILKAHQLALQGLVLAPMRAEFFCLVGDCLVQQGKEADALPMYTAAAACMKPKSGTGFIFVNHAAYDHVPRNALSMIKFRLGDLDGALFEATECMKKFEHPETKTLIEQYMNLKNQITAHSTAVKVDTDEIVFSCIPNSHPYPFDEEIYLSKGIGGSETALVEVAKRMKKITGRNIIVFNTRETAKVCESGVEYRPAHEMYEYFSKYNPDLHIAWRHNIKVTDAKTFLWCHDLYTPGAEVSQNYEKHICLSPFHRDYVHIQQGIPYEKIHISRNGVNKERFAITARKDENKIIWPNSPDRGLDRAILIVERAREITGKPLELHVYYGLENLVKYGRKDLHDKLTGMIAERPWVKYHGNVDQHTLAREMKEAVIWLYNADFIETFCITAIEAMYAGCYGIVREVGALRDIVRPFAERDWAKLLFMTADTVEERELWAQEIAEALEKKKWEQIDMSGFDYSWDGVARDFLEASGINETTYIRRTEREIGAPI